MSKTGFHQSGTVVMACKHIVSFTSPLPPVGETVYCRYCSDYRAVEQSVDEYYATCKTGRCKLNKRHGTDKNAALATARKHVQKYTRHKVTIFNGRLSVAEVTNVEETLFTTADDRASIARESQNLLRNLGVRGTAKPDGMG